MCDQLQTRAPVAKEEYSFTQLTSLKAQPKKKTTRKPHTEFLSRKLRMGARGFYKGQGKANESTMTSPQSNKIHENKTFKKTSSPIQPQLRVEHQQHQCDHSHKQMTVAYHQWQLLH